MIPKFGMLSNALSQDWDSLTLKNTMENSITYLHLRHTSCTH